MTHMIKDMAIKSRKSALHGIMCSHLYPITSLGETDCDIQKYIYGMLKSLSPSDALEYMLAIKICTNFWRFKRLAAHESALIARSVASKSDPEMGYLSFDQMRLMSDYDRSLSKAIQIDIDLYFRTKKKQENARLKALERQQAKNLIEENTKGKGGGGL